MKQRVPWAPAEDQLLLQHPQLTAKHSGESLGTRTYRAIQTRRGQLGLTAKPRLHKTLETRVTDELYAHVAQRARCEAIPLSRVVRLMLEAAHAAEAAKHGA